jgi:transposase
VAQARERDGRAAKTTFGIVDAQSVKNADTAREKGYDAGKKVSGIKRHPTVDTNGLPHAIHVTTADVGDRQGALEMFSRHREALSEVRKALVDGGYTGEPFAQGVAGMLGAAVEVAQRNELHKFVVIPSAGRWSAASPGWRNVGACGKMANANSTPVCNSSSWLSCGYCLKDREQALSSTLTD